MPLNTALVKYFTVKWNILASVLDGADIDTTPDLVNLSGVATFTPNLSVGQVIKFQGIAEPFSIAPIKRRVTITAGQIWHQGQPWVKLESGNNSFASPVGWNWRVDFDLIYEGVPVPVKSFNFDGDPDTTQDLTDWMPIQDPSSGAEITRGPRGYGIDDVSLVGVDKLRFSLDDEFDTDLPDLTIPALTDSHQYMLDAQAARDASVTAKTASEAARDASVTAKTASETAKTASETARDASVTAKTASESARDASVTAKTASETAKTASETARDASVTAKTASESARDASVAAKDLAVTAKTNAETAASTATTQAGNASSSATAAAGSATTASGHATTATTKAGEASSSASAAAASAAEAAGYVGGVADNAISTVKIQNDAVTGVKVSGAIRASLALADNSVQKTGAETIAGVKTFSSLPELPASDPTTSNQPARKSYVDAKYTKPGSGIPSSDMASAVQTSLSKADSAIQQAGLDAAKLVTINAQTASYTLVLSDGGKAVEVTNASATNVTVPPNSSVAFPVGTVIELTQVGAGKVNAVAGAGVTINNAGSLGTRAQWSSLVLRKRATDTWLLTGDMA